MGRDLQVLPADRHARLGSTRDDDIVDEAGKRRNAADEKGDYGPPIGTEFGRVAVHYKSQETRLRMTVGVM